MSDEADRVIAVETSAGRALLRTQYFPGPIDNNNAYGTLLAADGLAIICGHGGSMWLCASCKETIVKALATKPMSETSPRPGEIGQLVGVQCMSHENIGEGIVYSLENPCSDPKCDICHEAEP